MSIVLLIENEKVVSNQIQKTLEDAGHVVMVSADGHTGVTLCEEYSVDLVITKIFMPEMDGLEVIRALHNKNPAFRLMAISGDGTTASAQLVLKMASAFGAHKTLSKPFTSNGLLGAVAGALGKI
ncbi:MAG: response regulator [Magnetococcales bacterium]|nr:response regulator [Magnetococcales bacterium]